MVWKDQTWNLYREIHFTMVQFQQFAQKQARETEWQFFCLSCMSLRARSLSFKRGTVSFSEPLAEIESEADSDNELKSNFKPKEGKIQGKASCNDPNSIQI